MIFISILIIIVAIALPSINKQLSSIWISRISAIVFMYSGALAFNALYIQSIGSEIGIYSGLFHITIISQLLDAFLLILSGLILIAWPLITSSYYNKVISFGSASPSGSPVPLPGKAEGVKNHLNNIGLYTPRTEYCLIVLFSGLGSSLLISCSDLLSMYLSIELQSFGLYILATLYKDYESATASGLKYFLLGALSSCFILLGAGLIYTFTGLTNFESIYSLISVAGPSVAGSPGWLGHSTIKMISGISLGAIFIYIGYLFKISAAPMHSWSPDVYDETPTQVTTWLTIIPKISILVLLLELQSGLSIGSVAGQTGGLDPAYVLKNLLLISSLFSLIIGTVVGLAQTRIKRLLAYSTISHIGFILLALAINTEQSIDSFLFYIFQYSLTNLNIFLIIIALGYIIYWPSQPSPKKLYSNGLAGQADNNVYFLAGPDFDIRYISTIKGQFFANPLLSLSLAICLFSMAGVPPLLGFFSKQFVLYSAIQSGYYFMSFVCIITSVISASYYLRIVILLFTDPVSAVAPRGGPAGRPVSEGQATILSNSHSFLISALTLSILLFIFKPTLLLNSTQLLALSLFNF